MAVIEGKKGGEAMETLIQQIPKEQNGERQFLINNTVGFREREYGHFQAILKTIKLTQTMESIAKKKHVYMRSHVAYPTYEAFSKLYDVQFPSKTPVYSFFEP